jgi:hypothetical protein
MIIENAEALVSSGRYAPGSIRPGAAIQAVHVDVDQSIAMRIAEFRIDRARGKPV